MKGKAYRVNKSLVWMIDQQFSKMVYVQITVYLEQSRVCFNGSECFNVPEFF